MILGVYVLLITATSHIFLYLFWIKEIIGVTVNYTSGTENQEMILNAHNVDIGEWRIMLEQRLLLPRLGLGLVNQPIVAETLISSCKPRCFS